MPWTTSLRSFKLRRHGRIAAARDELPPARCRAPFAGMTGATRCSTSCSPIVSPTGRSTHDRCSIEPGSRSDAGVRGRQRPFRVALGPLEAVRRRSFSGRHAGRHQEPAPLPGESRGHDALDRPGVQAAREGNDFHGYGVQDFLEVDPRFGTRAIWSTLVDAAHALRHARHPRHHLQSHGRQLALRRRRDRRCRSGRVTRPDSTRALVPMATARRQHHESRSSRSGTTTTSGRRSCSSIENYTRAGTGSLGAATSTTRTPSTSAPTSTRCATWPRRRRTLGGLIFMLQVLDRAHRLRRLPHRHAEARALEEGRNFCGAVKEFAESIGKSNFLLVGEIAGGDDAQEFHLDDLRPRTWTPRSTSARCGWPSPASAKGLRTRRDFLRGFDFWDEQSWARIATAAIAPRLDARRPRSRLRPQGALLARTRRLDHQVASPTALQLFALGIPCIYYGTEQALRERSGRERARMARHRQGRQRPGRARVRSHRRSAAREAMFGPEHPRASGFAGTQGGLRHRAAGFWRVRHRGEPRLRSEPTRHSCESRR